MVLAELEFGQQAFDRVVEGEAGDLDRAPYAVAHGVGVDVQPLRRAPHVAERVEEGQQGRDQDVAVRGVVVGQLVEPGVAEPLLLVQEAQDLGQQEPRAYVRVRGDVPVRSPRDMVSRTRSASAREAATSGEFGTISPSAAWIASSRWPRAASTISGPGP